MFVYIMVGDDGWHKIGISVEPEHRAKELYGGDHGRPRVVRSFEIGRYAATIEYIAHMEMARFGIANRQGEWFESDADTCVKAIKSAKRKMARFGGYHGWREHMDRLNAQRRSRPDKDNRRDRPGRPPIEFSSEQLEQARAAWFSRDYATDRIAAKHAGMSREMCRRRWGSSGRPWPKRRKRK